MLDFFGTQIFVLVIQYAAIAAILFMGVYIIRTMNENHELITNILNAVSNRIENIESKTFQLQITNSKGIERQMKISEHQRVLISSLHQQFKTLENLLNISRYESPLQSHSMQPPSDMNGESENSADRTNLFPQTEVERAIDQLGNGSPGGIMPLKAILQKENNNPSISSIGKDQVKRIRSIFSDRKKQVAGQLAVEKRRIGNG